jgi:hypothetical protein
MVNMKLGSEERRSRKVNDVSFFRLPSRTRFMRPLRIPLVLFLVLTSSQWLGQDFQNRDFDATVWNGGTSY